MNTLHKYQDIIEGIVVKRPSRYVKSPYVADVLIIQQNTIYPQNTILCHAPSLGCNGMVNSGARVMLEKIYDGNESKKCVYKIIYVKLDEIIVGTNPYISNKLVFDMISNNMIPNLTNLNSLKAEKKVGNSRFDIYGEKTINNEIQKYYIEIKTAPIKIDNTNCAIFPEGYRKTKQHTISERANKHLLELSELKKSAKNIQCFIIFVVPRDDCDSIQPNKNDSEYCACFTQAVKSGVKILALSTSINLDTKSIMFNKFLKVKFPFIPSGK